MHCEAHIEMLGAEGDVMIAAKGIQAWLAQAAADKVAPGLRFAASGAGGGSHLVIGLRRMGAGVDLLIPATESSVLLPEPERLIIRSTDDPSLFIQVPWDEVRFAAFLDQVEQMRIELPNHAVWRDLGDAFGAE